MVKALYDDFDGQDTTEWFKIKNGVKQGCNMSGLLCLLVIEWVMRNSLQVGSTRIRWKFTNNDCINLDSRMATQKGHNKNNMMEKDGRERKGIS